jgi:hypothetical protein
MYELKPDYEKTRRRIEAFWEFDVLDHPVVNFYLNKPLDRQIPLPKSSHITSEQRWLDAEFQAELAYAYLRNRDFVGDDLPIVFPNLGPEIFSAFYGCPLHFGDYGTSWSDPILNDWDDIGKVVLDWESPWIAKLHEMTDILLEMGKDIFIVGMTDWHPGGDALAAFRDPQNLAMDMVEYRDEVKSLLRRVTDDYYKIYNIFFEKLHKAGQPTTSWTPLVDEGKYYIPSNDFSIMISKKMYDEVFLPGLIEECQFLHRSIYHLDGPGALRHLDSILAIRELNALQFVPGEGNNQFARWVQVYQKAQAARKGIQVGCTVSELPHMMETLNPRGLFLVISGVSTHGEAEGILDRLDAWTLQKARSGQA